MRNIKHYKPDEKGNKEIRVGIVRKINKPRKRIDGLRLLRNIKERKKSTRSLKAN